MLLLKSNCFQRTKTSTEKRTYRQQQVTSEANAQRTRRLEQLRRSRQERLADETDEQRASRLELLRRSQQERLADETEEQREVRLQRDAEQHQTVHNSCSVPLDQQRKSRNFTQIWPHWKFHSHVQHAKKLFLEFLFHSLKNVLMTNIILNIISYHVCCLD